MPLTAPASPLKTLLESIYSPQMRRFEESAPKRAARLTKTGPSTISRANCPQVSSGFAGGGSKWAETARLGHPTPPDILNPIGRFAVSGERPVKRTYQP